jgi:dTDP-4-amino-4,6-dideoxygalactose transaminase
MTANPISPRWALFGAAPEFDSAIPVGQLYFPSWQRYEDAMRGIFAREYYTNQGPLAYELEARLAAFLGVRHVVCVTNATIGLLMAVKALDLSGKVIVPAFTFAATVQALSWAGVEPAFCDVDARTHQISAASVAQRIDSGVSAILGVNLWGDSCRPQELQDLAQRHGLKLFFDSAHAFGCRVNDVAIGNFGSIEVFSFHATKILSATEGGCVCTNDDQLGARLRNIRSGYGAKPRVAVPVTSNGRMSEAQAAIALLSLEDFPQNLAHNRELFARYASCLASIPGLRVFETSAVSSTNYQYLVAEIDEAEFGLTRDQLLQLLKAENINARRYFHPGMHRAVPYCDRFPQYLNALPNTDKLCQTAIQFPLGALVSDDAVGRICARVAASQRDAVHIRANFPAA